MTPQCNLLKRVFVERHVASSFTLSTANGRVEIENETSLEPGQLNGTSHDRYLRHPHSSVKMTSLGFAAQMIIPLVLRRVSICTSYKRFDDTLNNYIL